VDTSLQRWSLRCDGPPILGNNATVQPVRTADGTPAVLRLTPTTETTYGDVLALSLWDGDGAVRLFAHHSGDDATALLLERLDHTRNLDTLPIEQAAAVAGRLRARLSRPAPASIPTLQEHAERWAQQLPHLDRLPKPITDRAAGICRELGPGATRHLVNEDQHYHNVLAADREPWLVIDPTVLAGDREYGLATLIWGRLQESTTQRILDILIDAENLDPDRARAWTFVGAVVKWAHSQDRVAHNCREIAANLSSPHTA
jgi:streptomycin 6-kinase